jgi:hypothetical protein
MLRNDAGGFKTDPVQRCARDEDWHILYEPIFHRRKQGKNIPFLPLISSENAVATSSAVVANENAGMADIVLLVFERTFN